MKSVLFLALALSAPLAAHAQSTSVETQPMLTRGLLSLLSSQQDRAYSGGMHQGVLSYAAQVECSNPTGDDNVATMKCYIRSVAGFSQSPRAKPVLVPGAVAGPVIDLLTQNNMTYLITNGFSVLGAKIQCDDNSGAGDGETKIPDTCTVSSLF